VIVEKLFAVGEMEIITRHGRTSVCGYNSENIDNRLLPPLLTKLSLVASRGDATSPNARHQPVPDAGRVVGIAGQITPQHPILKEPLNVGDPARRSPIFAPLYCT
jgi:hypothetical protein